MEKSVQIRPSMKGDAPVISTLIFNIWLNEYGFKVKADDYPDLKSPESYYQERGGHFLIACCEGQVVGKIACEHLQKQQYVLKRMFVDKKFRQKGIAQALLDAIFKELSKSAKNFSLFLSTKEDEALAAKNLYLKNEFKIISKDEVPQNFPFFYEDDLFMLAQR